MRQDEGMTCAVGGSEGRWLDCRQGGQGNWKDNSPTLAVLASSKAWRKGRGYPRKGTGESCSQECFPGRGGYIASGGGGSDVTDEPPSMGINLTLCVDAHLRCPYHCTLCSTEGPVAHKCRPSSTWIMLDVVQLDGIVPVAPEWDELS